MTLQPSQLQGVIDASGKALASNRSGNYHAPRLGHYPELFGWDSPMHAIGSRHANPQLAAMELTQLFKGQWQDGCLPNIQFPRGERLSSLVWSSRLLARGNAPKDIRTSGITQPPLAAEAILLAGKKLPDSERTDFWKDAVPKLVAYHGWLYAARCRKNDGLIEIVHPWESGMDNTPPLIEYMRSLEWGKPLDVIRASEKIIRLLRKDLRHVDHEERSSDEEAGLQAVAFVSLLRNRYDVSRLQDNHPLHVADVAFNSILARANTVLEILASEVNCELPDSLKISMQRTKDSFSKLKDPETGLYFSRSRDDKLIKIPTIASLLPIYSGVISAPDINHLVTRYLTNTSSFWQEHGIPTVPVDSPFFSEKRYWSGGVWGNMEWLLASGLARSGRGDLAGLIMEKTVRTNPGFHEYHSALTGTGYGVSPFSWSASVRLDFAHQLKTPGLND
jgi:hypothetical protein